MKYYFFYLEIPKYNHFSSGILEVNNDNMTNAFNALIEEIIDNYFLPLRKDQIIVKQFNRL